MICIFTLVTDDRGKLMAHGESRLVSQSVGRAVPRRPWRDVGLNTREKCPAGAGVDPDSSRF